MLGKTELSNENGEFRPGIVHRLDKNTTGVMVVAKNNFAHQKISKQIQNHEIKKIFEKDNIITSENEEYITTDITNYRNAINMKNIIGKDKKYSESIVYIDAETDNNPLGFILSKITIDGDMVDNYHIDKYSISNPDKVETYHAKSINKDNIDYSILENFFANSSIFEVSEIDTDIYVDNNNKETESKEYHKLSLYKWEDEDIYELSSTELIEDNKVDNTNGNNIENELVYNTTMYSDEYMMEVYSYAEGSSRIITTNIIDLKAGYKIYHLEQEIVNTLFEIKQISTYDLDGLQFRIQRKLETDIAGTTKRDIYVYESPELCIELDNTNNKILQLVSPLYNTNDDKVYIRNIWGCLEELDITKYEK